MFTSVLTKNLNWESLTKNLVTFTFNFNIMRFSEKSDFFRGGVCEKPIYSGELPKVGALDSLQI